MRDNFKFKDSDGKEINCYKWTGDFKPKAIIYIVHGMTETALRYDYVAERLVNEGYYVYSHDHRGHGLTDKEEENRGYIADNEGFDWLVTDVKELIENTRKENPGIEVVLFGHSMGSFVSQRYLEMYGQEIDRVILSGTSGRQKSIAILGIIIAWVEMKIRGRKHKSKLMDKLIFGNFNDRFKPSRTEFDWVCANEKSVDEYISSPDCGFVCTTSFYYDLMRGTRAIHKNGELAKIKKSTKLYIFAGDSDPVGEFGEGIKSLVKDLKANGVSDVSYKLYKDGRHEMLNDSNRDEVIDDMINFLKTSN